MLKECVHLFQLQKLGELALCIILGSSRFQYMMCSPSLSFCMLYVSILVWTMYRSQIL